MRLPLQNEYVGQQALTNLTELGSRIDPIEGDQALDLHRPSLGNLGNKFTFESRAGAL